MAKKTIVQIQAQLKTLKAELRQQMCKAFPVGVTVAVYIRAPVTLTKLVGVGIITRHEGDRAWIKLPDGKSTYNFGSVSFTEIARLNPSRIK